MMTNIQRAEIKEKIIQDLELINNEISELKNFTQPVVPDCAIGRLTRQEMIQEQQVSEHALHEAEIKLNRLKYALQKVNRENYGICAECEEEIIFERLMLLPESTHCVACLRELGL